MNSRLVRCCAVFAATIATVQASALPLRTRVTLSQWEERCQQASDSTRCYQASSSDVWKQVRGGGGGIRTRGKSKTDDISKLNIRWTIGGKDDNETDKIKKSTKKTTGKGAVSDLTLALQSGASAAMEAIVLFGILTGAKKLSAQSIPVLSTKVKGIPTLQWASFALVVFGSSAVKNMVDGGMMSAASNQARNVNKVPGDAKWYESLKKPWFNPPAWVFPIMWVIVSKPTQFWAVSRLFRLPAAPKTTLLPALAMYCTHLALGDVWNQVFFEQQRIKAGTGVISAFYVGLLASAELFGRIDDKAGFLMLPTVGWVTVATALNWEIYRLNRKRK